MAKKTKRPRVPELAEAAMPAYSGEHVLYEFDMYLRMASRVLQGLRVESNAEDLDMWKSLVTEGHALHLRNVIDFFYPTAMVKGSDVIAADFFRLPKEWTDVAGVDAPIILDDARTRAHKEVMHLTTGRKNTGDPTKSWDLRAPYVEIVRVMRLFTANAMVTRLSPLVVDLVACVP